MVRILLGLLFWLPSTVLATANGEIVSRKDINDRDAYFTYLSEIDSKYIGQPKDTIWAAAELRDFSTAVKVSAISYLVDGLKVRGFVFEPRANDKHPVIIYNRGGNRDFGSLTDSRSSIGFNELSMIASWGYVVVASQYRGGGGSEGVDQFGGDDVNDVLALPHVLSQIPSADTARVGLLGWSRGSMMSLIALKRGLKVKAVAVGGVVSDLNLSLQQRPIFNEMFAEMDPAFEQDKRAWIEARSAIKWVDQLPREIPYFLLSGGSDWRSRSDQAIAMAQALDNAAIPLRFNMYEGGNHSLSTHTDEVFMNLKTWFDRFVRDEVVAPVIDKSPKD